MIYPSLFRSKSVSTLDGRSFRLYIWLIANADDDGRSDIWAGEIAAGPWLGDPLTPEAAWDILLTLAKTPLIVLYEIKGNWFYQIAKWSTFQHVRKDRYQPSTYPQPSDNQVTTSGCGLGASETVSEAVSETGTVTEEEPIADAATRLAEREARDQEKLQAWESWRSSIIAQSPNGSAAIAILFLDRLEGSVDRFYADTGGSFTPTRKAALARRLDGAKFEPLLSAIEVYVDRYAGLKDERYFAGIAKKNAQLSEAELDGDIERHRLQFKGRGVYAEAMN